MPRKPAIDQAVPLTLKLPESWRVRLDLLLFSSVEGRVPKGGYQAFFIERLQEFFDSRQLDLSPFGFPAGYSVRGQKDIIDALERKLKSVNLN